MDERHGQIATVSNGRLELAEERGRPPGGLLEKPAEVQLVREAQFASDLFDRPERVQQLPFGVDQDPFTDKIGHGLPEVLAHEMSQRLGRHVQQRRIVRRRVQRAVVLLHDVLHTLEQLVSRVAGFDGDARARFQARRDNEQDLEIREHGLGVSDPALALLTPDPVDQDWHVNVRVFIKDDGGRPKRVVEKRTAAARLRVKGLDAQEIRVKSDHVSPHRSRRNKADSLVGSKEQERAGGQRVLGRIHPHRTGTGPDPVHREIVGSPRLVRGACERQPFDRHRLVAFPRVEESRDHLLIVN